MKILITDCDGVWGHLAAAKVLDNSELIDSCGNKSKIETLFLFVNEAPWDATLISDDRVEIIQGNISNKHDMDNAIIDNNIDCIIHIENLPPSSEENIEAMLDKNIQGTLNILEACRKLDNAPQLIFCSSCAVFPAKLKSPADENTNMLPAQSTYGTTKAVGELLLNNYTKKGFIDGRSARWPTMVSWKPYIGAADLLPGLFKEVFNGEDIIIPIHPETEIYITGYRNLNNNLIKLQGIPKAALGDNRALIFPGITCTLNDIISTIKQVSNERQITIGDIVEEYDNKLQNEIGLFNKRVSLKKAEQLGLSMDTLLGIVNDYLDDYLSLCQ